jgi:hypothetical protein
MWALKCIRKCASSLNRWYFGISFIRPITLLVALEIAYSFKNIKLGIPNNGFERKLNVRNIHECNWRSYKYEGPIAYRTSVCQRMKSITRSALVYTLTYAGGTYRHRLYSTFQARSHTLGHGETETFFKHA